MKNIFQIYGRLIICIVSGILLLGLVGGVSYGKEKGLNKIAGSLLNEQVSEAMADTGATDEYAGMKREKLQSVVYRDDHPIICNTRVVLEDYFKLEITDGSQPGFDILSLTDGGGEEIPVESKDGVHYAQFPFAGCYRIWISVKSGTIRQKEATLNFPVEDQ